MDPEEFDRLMQDWQKKRALTVGQLYRLVVITFVASFIFGVLALVVVGLLYGNGISELGSTFTLTFLGSTFSAVFASLTIVAIVENMRAGNLRRTGPRGGILKRKMGEVEARAASASTLLESQGKRPENGKQSTSMARSARR
jgi:hypothetical protein